MNKNHFNNFLYSPTEAAGLNSALAPGRVRAGIIGGAGYTGGELIRLLLNHPYVEIVFVHSKSKAGKFIYEVHSDLINDTDLKFVEGKISPQGDLEAAIDVLFLCLGHGDSKKFLEKTSVPNEVKIIDLSQDFRLSENSEIAGKKFVYGLPELNKEEIKTAENIANPGCFATAIQLGLLPLAKAGLLKDVYTTGITGSTGAGQSLSETTHFSWRANNISAYKTLSHQHLNEITQSIQQLQISYTKGSDNLYFVPWRGDFTRGIFISSTTDCNMSKQEVNELYTDFYKNHPFTHVSDTMINLKQVVNTNKCLIHIEKVNDKAVIHSALDNLSKGASGQAVQNMNLMFGLKEETGLKLKSVGF